MNDNSSATDLVAEYIVLDDGKRMPPIAWAVFSVIVLVVAVCVLAS